jgi:hypothetical protein
MLRRIHPPSLYIAFLDITELHALPVEVGPSQHGLLEMAALSPILTTPTPPINDNSKTTRSLVDAVKKTGLTTLYTPQQGHDHRGCDICTRPTRGSTEYLAVQNRKGTRKKRSISWLRQEESKVREV